jgi:hypothetical protein
MAERWALCTERGNLTSEVAMTLFDLAQQTRRMTVQTENLDFSVGTFSKRKDGFIDRAAGDREFLLDSTEQFKGHR